MGRKGGIRPADLVGAIANESGLSGRDIGPIRITEHSSVVGVPSSSVDVVIGAMRNAVVRGKQVAVRRYSEEPRERADRPFRGGDTSSRPERSSRGFDPRAGRPARGGKPVRGFGAKPGGGAGPSPRPKQQGRGR